MNTLLKFGLVLTGLGFLGTIANIIAMNVFIAMMKADPLFLGPSPEFFASTVSVTATVMFAGIAGVFLGVLTDKSS